MVGASSTAALGKAFEVAKMPSNKTRVSLDI
jgi:hypothetical protein